MTFEELGLSAPLVANLANLGYEVPTPIQEKTIPLLLAGGDVIGQAQTGTGKTAAFALPMLQRIDPGKRETQALVLTPTRELAMQVAEAIHSYSRGLGTITVLPVYGGAPMGLQLKHLQRGVQIVVGTPGRLIDHLERGTLDLSRIRMIVLDEADEMLRMGFIDDVEQILAKAPAKRQVALFSATMPAAIVRISQRYQKDATRVEIEHRALTAPAIEQRFINLAEGQKLEALMRILELDSGEASLIFRRTKTGAAELAERLQGLGFAAEAMHGDMNQSQRENVIRRLKKGDVEIVVATDVAARGLDVEQIAHVINYDVPNDVEAYVHRIGRTGRAGRSGVATLFVTPRERRMMREIEQFTKTAIKPMKIPTGADVAARRVEKFKGTLRKSLKEGDLELYLQLVEEIAESGPYDMADVAAAAARVANSSRSLAVETEARPVEAAPARPHGDERKVVLSIALGKRDGIRPADVVGSIANEANVPGRDIGPIDIGEDITLVSIPERFREQVLAGLAGRRFRGKPVNVRVAKAHRSVREKKRPRAR